MRLAVAYLSLQGVAGAAWWIALAFHPPTRACFKPPEAADWSILAFWLADLSLFVGGSLLAGLLLAIRSPAAGAALWFTAGAVSYATLYCLGLSFLTNTVWLASATMLPAMFMTLLITIHCHGHLKQ
jgi:hypothetical protein